MPEPLRRALAWNVDFEDEIAGRAPSRPLPPMTLAKLSSRFLFLGDKNDTLLASFELPEDFRRSFADRGIELPRVAPSLTGGDHELVPWGAAPSLVDLAKKVGARYEPPHVDAVRKANSKAFAHELATRLGLDPPGAVLRSREEVEARLAAFRERELWVVKRAFGFAGRGHLLGRGPSLPGNGKGWLESAFSRGDPVVLEPWLEREGDLSAHFTVLRDGKVSFLGVVEMLCAKNGCYLGNRIGALALEASFRDELERVALRAGAELAREGYFGPAGIDAFVSGGRLRALVEVNARHSMGRIALSLSRLLPEGGAGSWLVLKRRPREAEGGIVTDPFPDEPGPLTALVVARSREELLEIEERVRAREGP
ncbi:hypothetical protein HY251_20210 [bacterium]|nr:hypothetical protein [bacterium]